MSPASPSLRLVLVRHGETEWTERGILHGRLDSPLSATGKRHVEQTASKLRGEQFDALYSSPLGRAFETATILGETLGLDPVPLDGLQEMDFGWTEGKPLRWFDPDGTGAHLFRPLMRFIHAVTAERPEHFADRLRSAVNVIEANHPGGRVLAVTHWAAISMLMAILVDKDLPTWRSHGPWAAGGISELCLQDGSWQAVSLNEHKHLIETTNMGET